MKKLNILFDASSIFNISDKSGIYYTTLGILKQFKKNSFVKIKLCINHISIKRNIFLFFSVSHIFLFEKEILNQNINRYWVEIKNTTNIFNKIYLFLKLLKNNLLLLYSAIYSKKINKIICNTNIYFSPIYTIPKLIKNTKSIKCFHLLHDCVPIIFKDYYPNQNLWYTKVIQNLNTETYYFCNSKCTKEDFFKYFPNQLDFQKMYITPLSAMKYFFPNYNKNILKKVLSKYNIKYNTENYYIFSLCNIEPRKNLIFTIKCFVNFLNKYNIKNLYFYLGGVQYLLYKTKFSNELSNFKNYHDRIVLLGYIEEKDLNILYSNSLFFTYLSQYEGFGMPPLEAMQAGTPIICSNNSSLPEVVGDAAITITYNDESACIKAFEDLYFNENLRKLYITKGIERAKLFSWEKTVNIMLNIMTEVV